MPSGSLSFTRTVGARWRIEYGCKASSQRAIRHKRSSWLHRALLRQQLDDEQCRRFYYQHLRRTHSYLWHRDQRARLSRRKDNHALRIVSANIAKVEGSGVAIVTTNVPETICVGRLNVC